MVFGVLEWVVANGSANKIFTQLTESKMHGYGVYVKMLAACSRWLLFTF